MFMPYHSSLCRQLENFVRFYIIDSFSARRKLHAFVTEMEVNSRSVLLKVLRWDILKTESLSCVFVSLFSSSLSPFYSKTSRNLFLL